MAKVKAREIFRMIAAEGRPIRCSEDVRESRTFRHIREACDLRTSGQSGGISLEDFSIRDLFANLVRNRSNGEPVGEAFVQEFFKTQDDFARLSEAGGSMAAVDYTMFAGITGQLLITKILDGYKTEDFVASQMIPTYSSPLEQERWPGISMPADPDGDGLEDTTEVPAGKDYPTAGFSEEYIETPMTKKHGVIIPVTREAVFFDRTGFISRRASQVGYLLGLRKEKRILGCMIGGTVNPIRFREKRQFDSAPVSLDLFQYVSGTGQYQQADTSYFPAASERAKWAYLNDVPSNPLTDYTNVRTGEQYFAKTRDPNTGEPVVVGKPFVFCTKTRELDIIQILQAENIWKIGAAGLTTAGGVMTGSPNVLSRLPGGVDFKLSRQLRNQIVQQLYGRTDDGTAADKVWFYGDPTAAFSYIENWPITVTQAPPSSEAEFQQDIILRFKGSERGTVAIVDPRQWQRHNYKSQS